MWLYRIKKTAVIIQQGGVIAYPTEAVFGLGCDPLNLSAVLRLLQLKKRSVQKGLILIAHDWKALMPFLQPISPSVFERIQNTTTPCTWVLPVRPEVPEWITGQRHSIAVRVIHHPIANELCRRVGYPIVSTSANRANQTPLRTRLAVKLRFKTELDDVLGGAVGDLHAPTPILDPIQDIVIRT